MRVCVAIGAAFHMNGGGDGDGGAGAHEGASS